MSKTIQQIWDDLPPMVTSTIVGNVGAAMALAGKPCASMHELQELCSNFIGEVCDGRETFGAAEKTALLIRVWEWCIDTAKGNE